MASTPLPPSMWPGRMALGPGKGNPFCPPQQGVEEIAGVLPGVVLPSSPILGAWLAVVPHRCWQRKLRHGGAQPGPGDLRASEGYELFWGQTVSTAEVEVDPLPTWERA